jgi:hypothetical protein
MSCTISISDASKDIWIIRNAIFRWLIKIVEDRFPNDAELSELLLNASHLGGISLELEYEDNPNLTNRITKALIVISEEIAQGTHALIDDYGKPWPELQDQCQKSFQELLSILKRAPFLTLNSENYLSS